MKMVKISIISSLYNAEKYIYGLFLSLKKQEEINKNEFEIILLDANHKFTLLYRIYFDAS